MNRTAEKLVELAMDHCPSYKIYRNLFPGKVIPRREREFLKKVYPIDMSRKTGRQIKFHGLTYQKLKTLLRVKDECI